MASLPQHLKMRISENNGLPWTQTQEYKNLCRTISRLGDPTAYSPAHPQGSTTTDMTQFQVGLARSNVNNLPDVFYHLWPSKEWWDHTKSARPLPKRDADGKVMRERTPRSWAPRELLDFPILRNLDTISSEAKPWFLELLMRMDGKIEWTDLLMRMEYPGTTEKDEQKFRNRLQQRMARLREKFMMVSWRLTAGENNAIRDRVLSKLSPAQLAARGGLGSTRGSTPGSTDSQGKVIPVPGRMVRGTTKADNAASPVQQQAQIAQVDPSSAFQQEDPPIGYTGFSAVNSQQTLALRSYGDCRTDQQGQQASSGTSQPSISSGALPNHQHEMDLNTETASPPESHLISPYTNILDQTPYSAATSRCDPSFQVTLPIMGDRRIASAANTMLQQSYASASSTRDAYSQEGQDTMAYDESLANQYSQPQEVFAGPQFDECSQMGDFSLGDSSCQQGIQQVAQPFIIKGNDGNNANGGSDADDDDDTEDREDGGKNEDNGDGEENDGDDEKDGSDEIEETDAEMLLAMPLPEEDPRMASLTPDVRRELSRCMKQDRTQIYMCVKGKISIDELMSEMERNYVQLISGLKRARGEISDDEEVEEMQGRRVKRTRKGGDAAGPNGHATSTCSGFGNTQPGPWGEFNRHGALAKTSRLHTTRPKGSAVQRLHNDRARRPATKADVGQKETYEFPYYPQPDLMVYTFHGESQQPEGHPQQGISLGDGRFYTNAGQQQQHGRSSHRQRQPGTERLSSARNPTIAGNTDVTESHAQHGAPEGYGYTDLGNPSNLVEGARNDVRTAPRRPYQRAEASTARDDPFFSDELFNGMLNGQPDTNHVGSMYTRSQQQEHDEYYQRVMAPRPGTGPESNAQEYTMPSPLRYRAPPQTNAQVESEDGLEVGDIAGWDPAWSEFVDLHDSEPLLRGHYPDEYPARSPSRDPPQ